MCSDTVDVFRLNLNPGSLGRLADMLTLVSKMRMSVSDFFFDVLHYFFPIISSITSTPHINMVLGDNAPRLKYEGFSFAHCSFLFLVFFDEKSQSNIVCFDTRVGFVECSLLTAKKESQIESGNGYLVRMSVRVREENIIRIPDLLKGKEEEEISCSSDSDREYFEDEFSVDEEKASKVSIELPDFIDDDDVNLCGDKNEDRLDIGACRSSCVNDQPENSGYVHGKAYCDIFGHDHVGLSTGVAVLHNHLCVFCGELYSHRHVIKPDIDVHFSWYCERCFHLQVIGSEKSPKPNVKLKGGVYLGYCV